MKAADVSATTLKMKPKRPTPEPLREADAKAAVLQRFRELGRISRHTIIANEFSLGVESVRADLALFGEDSIVGIEIKTDLDSLKRLPRQMDAYRRNFDEVVLIAGERQLQRLDLEFLSDVEVWRFASNGSLDLVHSPKPQGRPLSRWPLLTSEERASALRGCDRASGIDDRVISGLLKRRFKSTSDDFWQAVGRGKVRPAHLPALSRFEHIRAAVAANEAERCSVWHAWEMQMDALVCGDGKSRSVSPFLVGV